MKTSRTFFGLASLGLVLTAGLALAVPPAGAAPAPVASDGPPAAPARKPAPSPPSGGKKGVRGPTTTDLSALRLRRHIMVIRLEKGFFEITEFLDFFNEGKTTIVSKNGAPTLRLVLPRSSNIRNPAAEWTSAPAGLDPKRLSQLGNQLLSTEPIPPGRKFVVAQYRLADEYGGIRMKKPVVYGTASFAVLPEVGKVQMTAQGLTRGEPVKFQDREFDRFTGSLRAGGVLQLDMKAPDSMGGLTVFYVALAVLVAGGGIAGVWFRRRRAGVLSRRVEREELLRAIAALDDRRALGEVSADEHRRERAPRFARLRELS